MKLYPISLFSFLGIFLIVTASYCFAGEVQQYDSKWGNHCNSSKSFSVQLVNRTGKNIDCRVCLEKTNGKWGCFMDSNVKPNGIIGDHWGYFVCKGTGKVKWYWRDAGDYSTKLGHPDRD